MRPILAVDVDGVLNALSRGPLKDGQAEADAMSFRIRYRRDYGARLLAVAEETGAELVWCTTWQDKANEWIAPLVGLPELPWVDLKTGYAGYKFSQAVPPGMAKSRALMIHAGNRPFAWLDDDARPEHLAGHQAPCHLVQVNSHDGLTERDLMEARQWLLDLNSGGQSQWMLNYIAERYGTQ